MTQFLNTVKRVSNVNGKSEGYVIIKLCLYTLKRRYDLPCACIGYSAGDLLVGTVFPKRFGSLREGGGIDMSERYLQSKRKARIRLLKALTVIVLFAGIFLQITMLARISAENKRADQTAKDIVSLGHRIENIERDIDNYRNSNDIMALAIEMGMQNPDQSQLRPISVENLEEENTFGQTAEESGVEKKN